MNRVTTGLAGLGLVASLGLAYAPASASEAAPPQADAKKGQRVDHDLPNPLEQKRRELREQAISDVLSGDAKATRKGGSTVVKTGKKPGPGGEGEVDQYVELAQERADKVFVILAEFGDQRHPDFPDADTDPDTPGPEVFDGPLHNNIAEPDADDNSTVWQADYNREHYEDVYFADGEGDESLKTYYEAQSSGRYTVDGVVQDWVKVPYNEARYGREDATTWNLISDAVTAWVADQKANGVSDAEIAATVASYDQWDRYDFNGNGIFEEPDGYIDHFQIVHAGHGEEDGDATQGEDAIWSHRWYAFYTGIGSEGPASNPLGGTQIGDTGVWIGDYTVQPENGGRSVFFHEYGHDLGLPDAYDTSGGGDNSNEYWTLMAQSRLNAAGEALGERAGDLGAWEKLQLGWLDYEIIRGTEKKTVELGPQEYNSAKKQGAIVVLPKKPVTVNYGAPFEGAKQFHSGSGDDLNNTLTAPVDLTGKSSAALTAKVHYDIEAGYDYLYTQVSEDGGESWTSLPGTVNGTAYGVDPSGVPAIDGTQEDWADLVVPLDAYAGKSIQVRWRYLTDGGVAPVGFFADTVKVTADGTDVLSENAEAGLGAFAADGFATVGATATSEASHYYIGGHRSYVSYDKYLKTGPYNFGWANTKPNFVEHYSYGQGLLFSYWDTSVADNNTNVHPGTGRNLPIDAHPSLIVNKATGKPFRSRIQVYDAPFGLLTAPSMTLHSNGVATAIKGAKGVATFDDTKAYWSSRLPNHGVKLPGVGIKATVVKQSGTSLTVRFGG